MEILQFEKDYRLKNTPQSAEINYLAESHYDEAIMIRTSMKKKMAVFTTTKYSGQTTIRSFAG